MSPDPTHGSDRQERRKPGHVVQERPVAALFRDPECLTRSGRAPSPQHHEPSDGTRAVPKYNPLFRCHSVRAV